MDLREMNAQLGKVELYLRKVRDEILEAEAEDDDEECLDEACGDDEDEEDEEGDEEAEEEEDEEDDAEDEED